MANNCYYRLKILGKENDVSVIIKRLKFIPPYNKDPIGRFFEACDEFDDRMDSSEEIVSRFVDGDCAWSIRSASLDREYGLIEATNRNHVVIEAYSEEPGWGFNEHYVICGGKLIKDECVDFFEYYWLDSLPEDIFNNPEHFIKALGINERRFKEEYNSESDIQTALLKLQDDVISSLISKYLGVDLEKYDLITIQDGEIRAGGFEWNFMGIHEMYEIYKEYYGRDIS